MSNETEDHKPYMVEARDRHQNAMYYHGQFISPEDAEKCAIDYWKKTGAWDQSHLPITFIVAEIKVVQKYPIKRY